MSPRHPRSPWNDATIARLRSLAPYNCARQIAKIMGIGRSAVIGKAYRLGITTAGGYRGPSKRRPRPRTQPSLPRPYDPQIMERVFAHHLRERRARVKLSEE